MEFFGDHLALTTINLNNLSLCDRCSVCDLSSSLFTQDSSLVAAGSFVTEERCADEIEIFNFEKVLRNIACGRCQK